MSKRIYVGNLPWSVDKAGFEELFSPFGEIEEALVIADKYTGRSRGFGFVTYKNDADADKAMEEMNEKDVEGRRIIVKEARPPREDQEKGQTEEDQKPKEEKQEPSEETKEGKEEKPSEETKEGKEEKPSEEEQKPKEKPVKKPKKEKPAEEKKEETEEK